MRILQICRQFRPSVGGLENVLYGLSHTLQQKGYPTDIVTLRYLFSTGETIAPSASQNGLAVYRLPHIGSTRYPIAPAVWSFLASYDIIHIHAIDFFVDFLSLTKPHHQKPLVVNTHGGIFHTKWMLPFKKAFFQTITRLSLRRADAVICDSQHDYRLFQKIVSTNKLHIIPNGVYTQPLLTIEKQITPGMLLGIGRIFENKGIERLIKVVALLARDMPHVHLVWVGPDSEQRIPSLLALAAAHGIGSRVRFVGQLPDEEVRDLLAQAHLFVSLSSYEAFGVATIEAMSSATVPVVTPVGVHPEVVQDGQTGFLCPFDEQSAAALLRRVLALDLHQLRAIGAQAQQVARRYSWERLVEAYLNVYRAVRH